MKFIGTFGSGHLGGFGLYYHVEVEAENVLHARMALHDAFNGKWCGVYNEDFQYVAKYGTRKLGKIIVTECKPEEGLVYYENRIE